MRQKKTFEQDGFSLHQNRKFLLCRLFYGNPLSAFENVSRG
jgi:hypothetical protein